MNKLFTYHRHQWKEVVLGHGTVAKMRRCSCGYSETYIFERTKHAFVWVPGNFLENEGPVFVISGSFESWLKNAQSINEEFGKEVEVRRVEGEADLDAMLNLITPRIFLTEDWFQSDLIDNPKFRALLMYR